VASFGRDAVRDAAEVLGAALQMPGARAADGAYAVGRQAQPFHPVVAGFCDRGDAGVRQPGCSVAAEGAQFWVRVAKRHKKHWDGLQGYILHPISNAAAEGFNSKIQNIKTSARGFRNFENFRYAILFYCGKLDLLPARLPLPQKS